MTTPLHIELMLHYQCVAAPYPRASAPAVIEYTRALERAGLIVHDADAPSGYTVTDGGRAYVAALQAVPFPVKVWTWTTPPDGCNCATCQDVRSSRMAEAADRHRRRHRDCAGMVVAVGGPRPHRLYRHGEMIGWCIRPADPDHPKAEHCSCCTSDACGPPESCCWYRPKADDRYHGPNGMIIEHGTEIGACKLGVNCNCISCSINPRQCVEFTPKENGS
jgi:hypothetical protein